MKTTEEILILPGDPSAIGLVCIADREDPRHCWTRAANHILRDVDLPFVARITAAHDCWMMADAIWIEQGHKKPPRSALQWGWGNFPHLGVDNRRKP
jgi:hypothetical protein